MKKFKKLEEIAYSLLDEHRGNMRSFHVAGIFKKNKLISVGFNKIITHPKTKKYNYHEIAKVHAELHCVIKGKLDNYYGYSLAVLRIDRNNNISFSKPCTGCSHMIKQLGFSKVFYTDYNGIWIRN